MAGWNPWHGCHKLSAGCANCYVYSMDRRYEKNSSQVVKNASFDLPIRKKRDGSYQIPSGEIVFTCFSSDFFVEEADEWRKEAWAMMKERSDLLFFFITKRIDRFYVSLPEDWGMGYENVIVCCTVENQDRANYRLPIYRDLPIRHKRIICAPLLEKLDLTPYLGGWVEEVGVGGESGYHARVCDFEWVLDIRRQCMEREIGFYYQQTGAKLYKDGKLYRIARKYQHSQAHKAGLDYRIDHRTDFS